MNLKNLRRALADPLARRLISKVDGLHNLVLRELGTIEDEVRQMEEASISSTVASMLKDLAGEIVNVARRLV